MMQHCEVILRQFSALTAPTPSERLATRFFRCRALLQKARETESWSWPESWHWVENPLRWQQISPLLNNLLKS